MSAHLAWSTWRVRAVFVLAITLGAAACPSSGAAQAMEITVRRADATISAERRAAVVDAVRGLSLLCGRPTPGPLRLRLAADGHVRALRASGDRAWSRCAREQLQAVEVGAGSGAIELLVTALTDLDLSSLVDGSRLVAVRVEMRTGPLEIEEARRALAAHLATLEAGALRCGGTGTVWIAVEVEADAVADAQLVGAAGVSPDVVHCLTPLFRTMSVRASARSRFDVELVMRAPAREWSLSEAPGGAPRRVLVAHASVSGPLDSTAVEALVEGGVYGAGLRLGLRECGLSSAQLHLSVEAGGRIAEVRVDRPAECIAPIVRAWVMPRADGPSEIDLTITRGE